MATGVRCLIRASKYLFSIFCYPTTRQTRARVHGQAAYTLIELSVVVAVVGVLIAGGIDLFGKKSEAIRYKTTVERLEKIEAALQSFVLRNEYLPCPATGEARQESGTTFGVSVSYDNTNTDACDDAPNDSRGVAPVRTLGLPDEVMFDGWGA